MCHLATLLLISRPVQIDAYQIGSTRPEVGREKCFLSVHGSTWFFFVPVLALLAFNSLMYLKTVLSLWQSNKANFVARIARVKTNELRLEVDSVRT
jgi:hypothetical protein